jgi:Spy/CpxP family protein refolding chaperone
MKTIFKLSSLLGLTALALAPLARADEPPATPAAPSAPAAGDHPHAGRGDRLKMLAEKLQLTDEQKTQIKPIMQKAEQDATALRDDDSLSKEDKRDKMMAIRKTSHDQIRALLTPDQQATYDAMPPERGHRGPPPAGGDAPPPPKPQ